MARQLTIIEYDIFKSIHPKECLNLNWTRKSKEVKSPNVIKMIRLSNKTTPWVVTETLSEPKLQKRISIVEKFILMAKHLRALNNYNGCMEILGAFGKSEIHRLQKTWSKVSKTRLRELEELKSLMKSDVGYKDYRKAVGSTAPPLIPFIGIMLSDLVKVEEGSKDTKANGHINFAKRKQVAEQLQRLQLYQQQPYNLEVVPAIQNYFNNFQVMTEKNAYVQSLELEPKR